MIYLEPEMPEAVTGERNWWFNEAVNHDPMCARQIAQLINGLWNADDSLAQQGLLLNLIDTFRPYARHLPPGPQDAAHRFERIRDYLHDNYMNPVTLDKLAAVVSLSPYHFQRQFKAHFHATPDADGD